MFQHFPQHVPKLVKMIDQKWSVIIITSHKWINDWHFDKVFLAFTLRWKKKVSKTFNSFRCSTLTIFHPLKLQIYHYRLIAPLNCSIVKTLCFVHLIINCWPNVNLASVMIPIGHFIESLIFTFKLFAFFCYHYHY